MNSLLFLAAFATSALAQSAAIGLPTAGQSVQAGSSLTVQVQRPNSLTGSEEVAVVIGLQPCGTSACRPVDEVMGTILYNGPFSPVYHETSLPPYENFSVTIPSGTAAGTAAIGVAHVTLIGAGPYPDLEVLNQTITVTSA